MTRVSALVLDGAGAARVGGMSLPERAVLLAHRAGLQPVLVRGRLAADPALLARLRARGVAALPSERGEAHADGDHAIDGAVVVEGDVLFGPSVLAALLDEASRVAGSGVAVLDHGVPLMVYVPGSALAEMSRRASVDAMASRLRETAGLREIDDRGLFCRRIDRIDLAGAAERDYIRHLNGRGESYFTKKIRRFSVPLTRVLVRYGARPAQVTLGGLVLAAASAWCIAQGAYLAGVLGGVLYYASMIFDCSDGEVARLTVRDSAFGAWLETVVDYVTYFLLLAALLAASQTRPGADAYRLATATALVGSLVVIAVAGYLRHRVASADPGQFDDATARALAGASRVHRFARWGRQWIKRSTVAHLVVALALIGQLPALLYLWAFGATVAALVIVAVEPFVVRRVTVRPLGLTGSNAGKPRGGFAP